MSRSVAVLLLVSSVVSASPGLSARQGGTSSNVIHFDGKKNPEMVPEYRVRAMTFRIFATGARILPDGVVEHVSKAEANLRSDAQRVIVAKR